MAEHHTEQKRSIKRDAHGESPLLKKGTISMSPENTDDFDRPFPFFREPHEIGCFSLDSDRNFKDNDSQLRYYKPPSLSQLELDLRRGYDKWIKRDETIKEYIDELLKWVKNHKDKFAITGLDQGSSASLYTDFICWRGLLTKLICTPYENRDGWIIAVTKFKGTHYLCEFDTEGKTQERFNSSEKEREMSYWGYKFEQYVCTGRKDDQPDSSVPVNTNEAYVTVVRGRLKEHSLVFAGEVDCVDDKGKYVELKTSREIFNERQDRNFKRFKLIKWWAQSFLPGVPTVICGFRDDDGVVRDLHPFKTMDIPNIVKNLPEMWKANVCFNFCDEFLSSVKKIVQADDPRVVYVFSWMPGQAIQWRQCEDGSEFSFLPKWYYMYNKTV